MMTEAKIQATCYQWYINEYVDSQSHLTPTEQKHARKLIFSVSNEAWFSRNDTPKQQQAKRSHFRAMGLNGGVSDMVLMYPFIFDKDQFNGSLFIEFKTPKGKQSPQQILFHEAARGVNKWYVIVRSVEEFKELFSRIELCKEVDSL
jgi:hypothetical protein